MLWGRILAHLVLGLPLLSEGSPIDKNRHSKSPTVDLGYAQYEGTALDIGVNQFLGIRYAAPPLGDLRFRAPEDPFFTGGVQQAKEVSTLPYCSTIQNLRISHHGSLGRLALGHLGTDQH